MLRTVALAFTFAVIGTAALQGQVVEWPERWAAVLEDSRASLEAGRSETARRALSRLLKDVLEAASPSDRTDMLLADVLTHLSLAEAGDGAADDAVWHWAIAQNIARDVASADLSRFGEPADLLTRNVLPAAPKQCTQPPGSPSSPTIKRREEVAYPRPALRARVGGVAIVQMELDGNGRPIRPQVLLKQQGSIVFAILMALREWRFEAKPDAIDQPFCLVFKFG